MLLSQNMHADKSYVVSGQSTKPEFCSIEVTEIILGTTIVVGFCIVGGLIIRKARREGNCILYTEENYISCRNIFECYIPTVCNNPCMSLCRSTHIFGFLGSIVGSFLFPLAFYCGGERHGGAIFILVLGGLLFGGVFGFSFGAVFTPVILITLGSGFCPVACSIYILGNISHLINRCYSGLTRSERFYTRNSSIRYEFSGADSIEAEITWSSNRSTRNKLRDIFAKISRKFSNIFGDCYSRLTRLAGFCSRKEPSMGFESNWVDEYSDTSSNQELESIKNINIVSSETSSTIVSTAVSNGSLSSSSTVSSESETSCADGIVETEQTELQLSRRPSFASLMNPFSIFYRLGGQNQIEQLEELLNHRQLSFASLMNPLHYVRSERNLPSDVNINQRIGQQRQTELQLTRRPSFASLMNPRSIFYQSKQAVSEAVPQGRRLSFTGWAPFSFFKIFREEADLENGVPVESKTDMPEDIPSLLRIESGV